jgi:hypothetical protein
MFDIPPLSTMQTVAIMRSDDFRITEGVAEGEGISFADELVMDDIYQLSAAATRVPLSLAMGEDPGGFIIDASTAIGKPGNTVYLDSCITLMGTDSTTYEVLVLASLDPQRMRHIKAMTLKPVFPHRVSIAVAGAEIGKGTVKIKGPSAISRKRPYAIL